MKLFDLVWTSTAFPKLEETGKRIALHLLEYLAISFSLAVLSIYFSGHSLDATSVQWAAVICLIISGGVETGWEVIYILRKYKESLTEQQLIQQLSTQQEFEHLKSQVNPHFLFNCFNTLSGLIAEDREKAESFLNELSKVYRYLLNSNRSGFSTVQSEISFIQSYLKLLKTRHGDALRVQIQVDENYYPLLLPSLSLQLLVENAVKHNVVSRDRPLTIEIFTTPAHQLVVNNNLQRKKEKEKSTRIGLNNIRSKYQLAHENGFQVVEGEKNFMAVLPLLKSDPMFQ